MIKFDGEETAAALTRRKTYGKITIAYIAALVLSGVCLAAFSGYAENNWNLYIVFLCVYSMAVLSFILFLVFFGSKPNKKLKYLVSKAIAEGFYARENILKGGNMRFAVDYSDDILTFSRADYSGEIIISPYTFKDGHSVADGGTEIKFDLTALKDAPAVYSTAGEKLLQFLQAYYLINAGKLNASDVTVTDNTDGKPCEIVLVENGKPVTATGNYFIKRGLIND